MNSMNTEIELKEQDLELVVSEKTLGHLVTNAKEIRDRMTDEELKAVPYFGNMKPYTLENAANTVEATSVQVDEGLEDLPF